MSTCRTGRTAPDTSCPRRRRQPQQRQRWLWPSLSSRFCCHVWWPWWFRSWTELSTVQFSPVVVHWVDNGLSLLNCTWFRSWSCWPFSSVLSPYAEWTTVWWWLNSLAGAMSCWCTPCFNYVCVRSWSCWPFSSVMSVQSGEQSGRGFFSWDNELLMYALT